MTRRPAAHDYEAMLHRGFAAMGTDVNLWVDAAAGAQARAALMAADAFIRGFDRSLTRFDPGSELNRLNTAPERTVEVSPLLARLVAAAREAAEASGGLVDPTLVDDIERAGYTRTLYGAAPAPLMEALAAADFRRPARPHPEARWRELEIDLAGGAVSRPPGVRIDSGGVGKGLAADMVAELWSGMLPAGTGFVIDCGGDLHFGPGAGDRAYEVSVDVPFLAAGDLSLSITGGGVATSGIGRRIWRRPDGSFAHHLLDPSTGEPAWTGVVSVTAVGNSALAAETTAKTALLSGPHGARRALAEGGGTLVLADGAIEIVAPGGTVNRVAGPSGEAGLPAPAEATERLGSAFAQRRPIAPEPRRSAA
ncbi:MAG: FAD:protein FMN transferase [Actinobacteria bacterium]|nr:FAD:protein FMN transferase [Actinomycetota bacterium]